MVWWKDFIAIQWKNKYFIWVRGFERFYLYAYNINIKALLEFNKKINE